MDMLEHVINITLDFVNPKITSKERENMKIAMEKIFREGKSPYEAIGFGVEFIEHLYSYGNGLFSSGNYKKACDVYAALKTLKPHDHRFVFAEGTGYHKLKKYDEAIECYINAAIRDGENPEPLFYLYDCFMKKEMPEEALESLIEAIKRCDNKKEHLPMKSKCVMIVKALQKEVEAIQAHQKNVKVNKEMPKKAKVA